MAENLEALATAASLAGLLPCPVCGKPPRVYHGANGDEYGDSVECDDHDHDNGTVWPYTSWDEAVRRWNEYAKVCK